MSGDAYLRRNRRGYYEVRWTEAGRTRSVSTRTADRGQAEQFLAQFQAGQTAPRLGGTTTGEILDWYVTEMRGRASYGTIHAIAGTLRPWFGRLEPAQITPELASRYARDMERRGRSGSTIYTHFITLRAAVNRAIKMRLLSSDQALTWPIPVRRSKPRDRWLTKDEVRRLLEHVTAPHIDLFVRLGVQTFARKTAILELTWDRVDWTQGRIDYGEGDGNKRRAIVPISDSLRPHLERAYEVATCPYVIEYGGHHVRDVRTGLDRAARLADVGHVHPHMLRHTGITWAVMAGRSLGEVARMAGTTEAIIERVYGHHHPDYLRGVADAVDL